METSRSMEIRGDQKALAVFCNRLQKAAPANITQTTVRLANSDVSELALGWPFRFVDQRVSVMTIAPDETLTTLLAGLALHLTGLLTDAIQHAHPLRESALLSRSVARELTRLLIDALAPLTIRRCPQCHGDICMRDFAAWCLFCMRMDSDGPLPFSVPDETGVCPAVEALLCSAVADNAAMLLYEVEHSDGPDPALVIDTLTFDDVAGALRAPATDYSEIRLQVFLRVE